MSLEAGRTLLNYRVVEKAGQGGMGEVWRARDTALDREVAIKVLPAAFAGDPERLARFEREARLLASLSHPNVAGVYGLHEDQGLRFIAMEWVPGEDLAARLARGPLPLEAALDVARAIARGLEAAHAAGVVHRDLKPANVRLTPEGKVKVLDFGLARGALRETSGGDPQASPTLTSAGTQAGMVLGTAAYMAPEQAKGRPADRRADVWAFGVVLFEMLTGTGAFRGDSIADTMASVLKVEPDFARLPPTTPRGVRRLLRRCLQKDPDRRLHDVADARIELDETDLEAGEPAAVPAEVRRGPGPLALAAAAGAGLVAGALLWALLGGKAAPGGGPAADRQPVRRTSIPLPAATLLGFGDSVAISPDGTTLVFVAGLDEEARLHVRRLESFEIEPIPGTDGAHAPFFSPDGSQVGFFAVGKLKKVALGGAARDVATLCDAPVGGSAGWSADGWIYFTFGESRLARVREGGGSAEMLGEQGDVAHVAPLPDGRGMLITIVTGSSESLRKDTAELAVLSPDARTRTVVLDGGYNARYASSGHLVFMRGGGLFAAPFDLERLAVTGAAVSVQPEVLTDSVWGAARYDLSADGTLVFVRGGDFAHTVPTWIDRRTGAEEPLPLPPDVYNTFDLSPDGTRLAIQVVGARDNQIHVYDATRRTFSRLSIEGSNGYPVWSHDGRAVFFASGRGDEHHVVRQPVDGSGPPERVMTDEQERAMETGLRDPSSATPDGRHLLIMTWGHPTRGGDIWLVTLDGSAEPRPLIATEANEIIPMISPDGRWLAYLSNRTGPYEIFVRPFPDVERREWQISSGEGYDARWSPRGDELLYRAGWGRLMSVAVARGDDLAPGPPREVFETDFHDSAGASFDLSPDAARVLVNKPVDVSLWDERPLTLITGWTTELSRRAPVD